MGSFKWDLARVMNGRTFGKKRLSKHIPDWWSGLTLLRFRLNAYANEHPIMHPASGIAHAALLKTETEVQSDEKKWACSQLIMTSINAQCSM